MSVRLLLIPALALAQACTPGAASKSPPPAFSAAEWTEACEDWDDWDKPGPPYGIAQGVHYVGTCGISAILVTGEEGHVLIDGGSAAAAPQIAANIEALGFALEDVKILLHSHEHYDHVGGLAALQRMTGARLLASARAAPVFETGQPEPDDPQAATLDPVEPARVDGIVADGDVVRLGGLALTAVATPGHAPGALSWHWRVCGAAGECRAIVYADSLTPASSEAYRFRNHPAYVAAYRAGLDRLATVDCDILLTPHPSASEMRDRLIAGDLAAAPTCAEYIDAIRAQIDDRLRRETTGDLQ